MPRPRSKLHEGAGQVATRLNLVLVPKMPTKDIGRSAVQAVDVFCGIGGLTYGLGLSGIDVVAGIDCDPSCRHAYETNNNRAKFVEADIRDLEFEEIAKYYNDGNVTALVGCAPCQPFSSHNRRIQKPQEADCSLVEEFVRLIREGLPDIVSMENVPGLSKHEAFREFLNELKSLGYMTVHGILPCSDYGVPQTRRRLVLLASRLGDITLPPAIDEDPTVADFLRELPKVRDGASHPTDSAHVTLPLTERNRRRIRQSRPGGTWKDWDRSDVSDCHLNAHYPASYGRMRWDALAPTITTQFCYYSTGRFGHPEQDRTISIREGALLQTFPPDYKLIDDQDHKSIAVLARHIGNAVPITLAKSIGQSIVEASNV